ncbi:Phosphopantothenoylcysteine decarboxylase, Phosphopantothenate-cysteine ligase [Desulfocurvibacter africanus PCS]|uniref:Coenzyme A biosynthesis bifunctional protein CoaBC n=1 Tax=Desulfocurvibacter africanus PCS TaxID=1262666 RepID=M5Q3I1_DESAF|nr:bifunctional phosphopantothenoylcysteine decarboxylase/phosphopantothenate--cysteine ligase CoaBC [Desulfocurvibacter africanus]EMG38488.1 Phosphopantothenoylcysteine decarboxylase, Phosphopantothenate-cysteine ligase [Desulfocurvibacter africanus PCS]
MDLAPHLRFSNYLGRRAHLGVCGSVAAYKTLDILRGLLKCNASVSATLTASAQQFVTPLTFEALGAAPVYAGMYPVGIDTFGHLEPAQNADALLVAPASANTLAKLANGLADDMLSCQALAFQGPVVLAPAMNTRMWQAPATQENWARLMGRGCIGVLPGSGAMACGEEGQGRLAEPLDILFATLRAMTKQDMAGKKVLVNLGPTREPWDAVRYLSNASSGTMGGAVAVAAWLRGAEVTVVAGPVNLWLPAAISRQCVTTAQEMFTACTDLWPGMDMACLTAAVADYRPKPYGERKFKKASAEAGLNIELMPNPDILKALGANKRIGQALIGFAAESHDLEAHARAKLQAKNLDLIVANSIVGESGAFDSPVNAVTVIGSDGRLETWPSLPKPEVAWRIWDIVSNP